MLPGLIVSTQTYNTCHVGILPGCSRISYGPAASCFIPPVWSILADDSKLSSLLCLVAGRTYTDRICTVQSPLVLLHYSNNNDEINPPLLRMIQVLLLLPGHL